MERKDCVCLKLNLYSASVSDMDFASRSLYKKNNGANVKYPHVRQNTATTKKEPKKDEKQH